MHTSTYTYIQINIYKYTYIFLSVYMYICRYIYIEREREKEMYTDIRGEVRLGLGSARMPELASVLQQACRMLLLASSGAPAYVTAYVTV